MNTKPIEKGGWSVAVLRFVCRVAGVIAALLFTSAALVIAYEAVMRYIGKPTSWAQDLAIYFMIVGAFLSQASVMLEDGHVRVDVFLSYFPKWLRILCIRVTLAISILYVFAMIWESAIQTLDSYDIGRKSSSLFRISTWIPESAIPIGFGLLLIAIGIQILWPKSSSIESEVDETLQL